MEKMCIWIILCIIISGTLSQTDLGDDFFTFPDTSEVSYVQLFPDKNVTFSEISLCMRFKTVKNRHFALFSLATKKSANSFTVEAKKRHTFSLSVHTHTSIILKKPFARDWTSLCVSWTSKTGNVELWIDGDYYEKGNFKKGVNISGVPFIIIGEEQDSYGGGFNKSQSFIGDIADVNLWDRALTEEEVMELIYHDNIRGNVITWRALRFNIIGRVTRYTAPCLPIN
ncbi:C-reactive protein-like [Eleutherodactylus coqui]|uniref:C-reactive protein-like n=1 Tax=Eleutherodactylus coqui TaxID=57060 RepID=UPI003462B76A